jgi:RNA polymerase sigma factor for flagellar operon FliA
VSTKKRRTRGRRGWGLRLVPTPLADTPQALDRIRQGLRLVEAIARQVLSTLSRAVAFEDLVSFGCEGLVRAARSFDTSRGVPFHRWAALRVRGAMLDGLRQSGSIPRHAYKRVHAMAAAHAIEEARAYDGRAPATPEAADACLSSYLTVAATAMALATITVGARKRASETPEDILAHEELMRAVRTAIAHLPHPERRLVERHYFAGATLEAAARAQGLSKSWGSRLHARAIDRIARELRRERIVGPTASAWSSSSGTWGPPS